MNTQASRRVHSDELPPDEEFFIVEKSTHTPEPAPVSHPQHRPFSSETPGAQIRAIREAHNVSAEEVAKRLYLDIQMIKNLEADNYSHLPPPIFVQGYLRAFAKLFEIPEEPLLAAYVKYNPNANNPPPLASENTAQMPKIGVGHHNSSGRWWYYVTWILVLIVTALVAWRYAIQTRTTTPPTTENASANTTITPPNTQTTSTPYTPPSEAGGSKAIFPPAGTPSLATTPAPVTMTPSPTAAGGASTAQTGNPQATTAGTTTTQTSMISTTSALPTGGTVDAGITPTPPAVAPSEDTNALILKFKDVSWARVVDSKKKKLYDGTSKPGQNVVIKEGVPPYEVSMNKVTTVDVFYKGQLMNLNPFKDQKTATFTVGVASGGSAQPEEEEEE